jgi:hypothetical protein
MVRRVIDVPPVFAGPMKKNPNFSELRVSESFDQFSDWIKTGKEGQYLRPIVDVFTTPWPSNSSDRCS